MMPSHSAPSKIRNRAFACLLVACGSLPAAARAADHLDAPLVAADGRTDINDVYAFQSPQNANNVVLVMTVNPLVGVMSPTTFKPGAQYLFHIDNNGDAEEDILFRIRFGKPNEQGKQRVVVERTPAPADALGPNGAIAIGETGQTLNLKDSHRVKFRADTFDDPFFFDLLGFRNNFKFTGDNFFEGLNVSAIVLEVRRSSLGSKNIGVWATTVVKGNQVDRMGRPAINTVLFPTSLKDAFNAGEPKDDFEDFGGKAIEKITALSGDAQYATQIAHVLLPDVLTIDTSSAAGFLNGRRLSDDVIDTELSVLTRGALESDGVDENDRAFSDRFPYLAPPQIAPPEEGDAP